MISSPSQTSLLMSWIFDVGWTLQSRTSKRATGEDPEKRMTVFVPSREKLLNPPILVHSAGLRFGTRKTTPNPKAKSIALFNPAPSLRFGFLCSLQLYPEMTQSVNGVKAVFLSE